ncbi:MAG TPA: phage holin family protein [Solirubrobacteraceae bacterium]|nr:phage holin family protein [Solirubrobacteraceae bacterium]
MNSSTEQLGWKPQRPRLRVVGLVATWMVSAIALLLAADLLSGVTIEGFWGAVAVAATISVLNAFVPPLIAAVRLPATLITGFVVMIVLNALMIEWASSITEHAITVSGFGAALMTALVTAAFSIGLASILGIDDDDEYTFRIVRRIARRHRSPERTDTPGLVFLEIDGLALPILRRAMQDGSAPCLAGWLSRGSHALFEWETDLSSQTGASQAGILLGSNADIPAFRWVEKERGAIMTCSNPRDCAEIERRHINGGGLLRDGGASRGNLLSGEADAQILTISRIAAEIRANPGYRTFLSNAYNVSRSLVLFVWEIWLELLASGLQRRRDIRPRGERGGRYPLIRAAMCVLVRDLIVQSVITDMLTGRPVLYATFSAYDEVAHHSGLARADTMEALRKLDHQFARIDRARAYTPRPYEIVVLSDHGQTQGTTFLQRNGYTLAELVDRHLERNDRDGVLGLQAGDEGAHIVAHAINEATGRAAKRDDKPGQQPVPDDGAVVLGSGNLGLIYLMQEKRRMTLEEIQMRHPRLIDALRNHPHIGWLLLRSEKDGPLVLGRTGTRQLASGRVEGEDPLAAFSPTASSHLLRTDGFEHVADIIVGSFYDPDLEEGCAFEELISFHGGLGGHQTRPFVLHPVTLPAPQEPIAGAEQLHKHLTGWRSHLQDQDTTLGQRPASPTPHGVRG